MERSTRGMLRDHPLTDALQILQAVAQDRSNTQNVALRAKSVQLALVLGVRLRLLLLWLRERLLAWLSLRIGLISTRSDFNDLRLFGGNLHCSSVGWGGH